MGLLKEYERRTAAAGAWKKRHASEMKAHRQRMKTLAARRPDIKKFYVMVGATFGIGWERVRQICREFEHHEHPERVGARPEEPWHPDRDQAILRMYLEFRAQEERHQEAVAAEVAKVRKFEATRPATPMAALREKTGLTRQRIHQLLGKARRAREKKVQA